MSASESPFAAAPNPDALNEYMRTTSHWDNEELRNLVMQGATDVADFFFDTSIEMGLDEEEAGLLAYTASAHAIADWGFQTRVGLEVERRLRTTGRRAPGDLYEREITSDDFLDAFEQEYEAREELIGLLKKSADTFGEEDISDDPLKSVLSFLDAGRKKAPGYHQVSEYLLRIICDDINPVLNAIEYAHPELIIGDPMDQAAGSPRYNPQTRQVEGTDAYLLSRTAAIPKAVELLRMRDEGEISIEPETRLGLVFENLRRLISQMSRLEEFKARLNEFDAHYEARHQLVGKVGELVLGRDIEEHKKTVGVAFSQDLTGRYKHLRDRLASRRQLVTGRTVHDMVPLDVASCIAKIVRGIDVHTQPRSFIINRRLNEFTAREQRLRSGTDILQGAMQRGLLDEIPNALRIDGKTLTLSSTLEKLQLGWGDPAVTNEGTRITVAETSPRAAAILDQRFA